MSTASTYTDTAKVIALSTAQPLFVTDPANGNITGQTAQMNVTLQLSTGQQMVITVPASSAQSYFYEAEFTLTLTPVTSS